MKKLSKNRLGNLVSGTAKWIGSALLILGTIQLLILAYFGISYERFQQECTAMFGDTYEYSRCLNEKYLYPSENIGRFGNVFNNIFLGLAILILRVVIKKMINYLWVEDKK